MATRLDRTRRLLLSLLSEREGVTAIEYAMIASIIALSIYAGAQVIGTKLSVGVSGVLTGF